MENRKIISLTIAVFLLCLGVLAENPGRIYVLDLNYDQGNLSLQDIGTREGYASGRVIQPDKGYRCDVLSTEGTVLESFRFDIPLRVYYDKFDPRSGEITGGVENLDSADYALTIPYFKNAKSIEFYDPDGTLRLSVDVSEFSEQTTVKPSTTLPAEKPSGITGCLIYLPVLLLIALVLFFGYRKLETKKIENQRREFEEWKEEQERLKGSTSKP